MSMNPERAAALSRFKAPLKDAFMLSEITKGEAGTSQGGRDQCVLTIAPVQGNNVHYDLALRAYVGQAMPGDDERTLNNIRRRGYGVLRAINPDFPTYPRRLGKGVYEVTGEITAKLPNGEVKTYEPGDQIGHNEYGPVALAIDTQVFAELEALADTVESLKGKRVFMKPQKAKLDEGGQVSQFIDRVVGDLADDEVYLEEDFVDNQLKEEFLSMLGLGEDE